MNRMILYGLKTQLKEAKDLQMEELYSVIWVYLTTPRIPMEESSFNLAYTTTKKDRTTVVAQKTTAIGYDSSYLTAAIAAVAVAL